MLKTPPLQTATATIDTLCGRLQSATLLEDRRGAILGLRSFAKQYPASVASGALRELIAILRRDGVGDAADSNGRKSEGRRSEGGDVDTIRLVLETLLTLFNPDSSSPEASEEIELFMADEFSMRQDNVTLLLSLLDPTSPNADYYSRLYSVQILSAICAARPERLQECILGAPLGVGRLVGVLDDGRDAVRNAGLLLLIDLTSGANEDLKKIVAFEDVFGKIFGLIRAEGGLAEAGITAQDCLSLLANLIKSSPSNQTMFRESGCVGEVADLLRQAVPSARSEAVFITQSREKATWGLLQLLGLFLVQGEAGTPQNQAAFFRANTGQILLDLGFSSQLPTAIRASAVKCAAALIALNPHLQEAFAALTVDVPSEEESVESSTAQAINGTRSTPSSARGSARASVERPRVYIIEALLELALVRVREDAALRSSSCDVVQAYLRGHDRVKSHFLQRAIRGHLEHESAANVLTTLLQPGADPLALLYASWIVTDLVNDQPEAKVIFASIKDGNESEGEDVLTSMQALGSQLHEALQQSADERVIAAYAGFLVVVLWEFANGVNDILADASGLLQALVATVTAPFSNPLVAGLAATLLGAIYEFSTKDSPIPRRTLAPLLTQKLGRSHYLEALTVLRRQPAIRDFDVVDEQTEVLLSSVFVDLFTVEFSRLRKAIDKDPGFEVLPPSAAEAGVDRDILDDLRQQLQTAKDTLSQHQQDALAAEQQHDQERLAAGKELQTANGEIERLRRINHAMQQGHEAELETLASQHEKQRQIVSAEHQRNLSDVRQQTDQRVQAAVREREDAYAQKMQDYERRLAELGNAHRTEQSGHTNARRQLETLSATHAEVAARDVSTRQELQGLVLQHNSLELEHQRLRDQDALSVADLGRLRADAEARDDEIKTLTSQVQELREESAGKDAELATERAGFSELEKELEAAKAALSAAQVASTTREEADEAYEKFDAERLDRLEAELKTSKESEKSAKEELESMFLVMSDIEAKRDAYRATVKELGGEVSEEDDEAEGEEDGEVQEEEDGGGVD